MTDPWRFQRWAFHTSTGNFGRKAVLSALAMMADANTGRCEAKITTLAEGTEMAERTVRGHLKALENVGLLARRPQFRTDGGRRGDEYLLRAPGIDEWPDGTPLQNLPGGGAENDPTPSPSVAGQEQPPRNGHASKQENSAREDSFPTDLPTSLHDAAVAAGRVLKAAALKRQQTREVTRATVGHAVLTYPDRDHLQVAREVEAWVLHGRGSAKSCRDIVARYRNFLANADPRPGPPVAGAPRSASHRSDDVDTLLAMAERMEQEG